MRTFPTFTVQLQFGESEQRELAGIIGKDVCDLTDEDYLDYVYATVDEIDLCRANVGHMRQDIEL